MDKEETDSYKRESSLVHIRFKMAVILFCPDRKGTHMNVDYLHPTLRPGSR